MSAKKQLEDKWHNLMESGKSAARNKDRTASTANFQEAYQLSRSFANDDRKRGESAYHLAYVKFLVHDLSEALNLFDESLQFMQSDPGLNTKCAHVHSLLASIHLESKEFHEAEQHIRASLEIERKSTQESVENKQLLAYILLAQRRYFESIEVLEKLLVIQQREKPQDVPNTLSLLSFARKHINRLDLPIALDSEKLSILQDSLLRAGTEARSLGPKYMHLGQVDYAKHFEKMADELQELSKQIQDGKTLSKRCLPILIEALWCAEVQARNSDCLKKAYEINLVKKLLDGQLRF